MLPAAAAVAALFSAAYLYHVPGSVEDWTMNKRFAIRGAHTPTDVAIVGIDEYTLRDLGQWPFPRRFHADVIRKIANGDPSAIAVDIQFTEPSDAADDSALVRSVVDVDNRAAVNEDGRGRVVLATTEVNQLGDTAVLGGTTAVRVGWATLRPSANGALRTLSWGSSTTWTNGERAFPLESFALVAAEIATGHQILRSSIGGATPIAYVGPPGTVRSYSYSDVLHNRIAPDAFAGEVVVIGATAATMGDVHATPYGANNPMSGPEIQANAIETALHGFPLRPSRTRALLLIALFSFLVPVAGLFLRWRWCLLLATAATVLYLTASQLSFDHGVSLPVTWPLLALTLGTVVTRIFRPARVVKTAD